MNKDKILEGTQLGLPPMELAETKTMNDVSYSSMKRYFYPTLHKIVQLILILIFTMGFYLIFTNQFMASDYNHKTEVIFLTSANELQNQTIDKSRVEIFVHLKNVTSHYGLIRKKRSIKKDNSQGQNEMDNVFDKITDDDIKKIREIILKHDKICNVENQNEVCKDLIMQLKNIISKDKVQHNDIHRDNLNQLPLFYVNQIDPKLTETCLLARLLKMHNPLIQDEPQGEPPIPVRRKNARQHRYFPRNNKQPVWKTESRLDASKHPHIHPQDLNIYMRFFSRDNECPSGAQRCKSVNTCINQDKWCNGKVDCDDSSDELLCDCKSRLHVSRICDGYFDCPLGEDEIGCYGCNETSFSCGDIDESLLGTCFSMEQRCNNIVDCPNHSDELDCSMLAPSIYETPIFAVSHTDGFLLRNFKGIWYPVCNNPDMWAIDACQRESGLVIRPPFIQEVPVDEPINTKYLNIDDNGIMSMSNTCFNSTAMYVTCADMLCGTRVLSDTQLVNENIAIENKLFGRNKRFSELLRGLNFRTPVEKTTDSASRTKRAETRVVGGTPSQPAAWPWIVALYRDGTFHCGGVILNQKWVMSAAHCVTEFWHHYYEVQVGMLRRFSFSSQEKNHIVTNIVIHERYSQENMQNDISLLKVKTGIQFGKWVRPICLPGPITAGPHWQTGPARGTICTAVGWGAMKEGGPDPDHLREVKVPIWENCIEKDDRSGKEICAGILEGGKDTCQGDSGGPLLCRNPASPQQWYIAGTVSHGNGCGRKGDPGVYTRVSLYRQWIDFNIFSESLPIILPKDECPGFKCTSGIKKCIPKKRICDKIVDCLHGEDETNCDYSKTTSILSKQNLFFPLGYERNTITTEMSPVQASSTDLASGDTETTVQLFTTSESNINQQLLDFTYPLNEFTTNVAQKLEHAKNLEHASTLEISITESSESDIQNNSKASTEIPLSSEENERGDTQFFTQSTSVESLESMSSVLLDETESSFKKLHLLNPFFSTPIANTTIVLMDVVDETTEFEKLSTSNIEFVENITGVMPLNNKTMNHNFTFPLSNHSVTVDFKPTFEDNDGLGEKMKIEEMLVSEIQPPKKRRKHKTPRDFECRRMFQVIPFTERCNHKADCEDGTDELDCSCTDYISAFDSKYLCDGVFDCKDGQDELDCFTCPENHFLCRKSKLCIPDENVCDGKPECPQKEDESNCFTLSNGHEMVFDVEMKPEFILTGYLTQKKNNDWHVICEDQLFNKEQEKAAENVCRHLGFSSAGSYEIKYISIKEENLRRTVRSYDWKQNIIPVKFLYKSIENDTLNFIPIIKPSNIEFEWKKIPTTCMALYVECDSVLVSDSDLLQDLAAQKSTELDHVLPWIAKVFADGDYKCTGVLLDLSWVLIPHSCLWDTILNLHFITVSLGSHRTQKSHNGPYEQIIPVDMKRDLYRSKVALLHLKYPAKYSSMVKPMNIPVDVQYDEQSICVAVGQDETNKTIGVFVEENNHDCDLHNRCFKRLSNERFCSENAIVKREWSGIISCHTKHGWYPAASFRDSRGECGFFGNVFVATDVGYLKNELKDHPSNIQSDSLLEACEGVRCARGRCISLRHVCDGVTECENGNDESEDACQKKKRICDNDPFFKGCECSTGELKCRNGKCISKDLFNNGHEDCADGTDEPGQSTCFNYLSRVMPSRLCDGVLHCHDRSDEDPNICKCYAKRFYKCGKSSDDVEYCVPPDVVCDGLPDCPNGEDEKTCLGLNSPEGASVGTGEINIRSHGVWHRKCFSKKSHTRTELEKICRQLGFISGHAKQLEPPEGWSGNNKNNVFLDSFHDIQINSNTTIKLRNTDKPLARSVVDETLEECYPVYIECL